MMIATSSGAGAPAQAQEGALPLRDQAYFRDATALADALGSAHGVRYLCNGKSDQYWRDKMIAMIDLEAPQRGTLRASLVDAFNSAFTRTRQRYRICNTATIKAEATFAAEGRALADRLARHYLPKPAR